MIQDSKFLALSGVIIAILISFCWFIAWKTHYNPTVTSTVVTALVAVVIGYVAAYMGARATLRATQQEHQNNLELQRRSQEQTIRGVVQAIYAELSSLWEIYRGEFGEEWDSLAPDEAFHIYYPLNQDYFTIFNANSALIGQIEDEQLRTAIVIAYLRAKGLIDSHLLNNQLIEEHKRLRHSVSVATDTIEERVLEGAYDELKKYRVGIQSAYEDAKEAVLSALKLMEDSGMVRARPRPPEKSTKPYQSL